jgi:cation diffusion facilitator family transporter
MRAVQVKKGAYISLVISSLLLIVKFGAFYLTHSQAVFSDALESIVNVVAASLALFVIYISSKPADRNHPYGHGKAEYFSSTVEGALISFAAVMIAIESVHALLSSRSIKRIDMGLALIIAAGIANALLGLYLMRLGKKSQSAALVASGKHVLSDFYTSAAVIAGLFAVRVTGIEWLDPVAAMVVAVVLAVTGFNLVRESVHALMDAEDTHAHRSYRRSLHKKSPPGYHSYSPHACHSGRQLPPHRCARRRTRILGHRHRA